MGQLRCGSPRQHGRICVGLPGGSSRSVGLRRCIATHAFRVEGRYARHRHHYKNGPRIRPQSPYWCSAPPRRGTPGAQERYPGEESWPTQPESAISVVPEKLRPEDAWGIKPEERQWCADKIKAARSDGIFTPPSLQGTLVFPSNVGGVNWGSAAYDPQHHLLFMDTNRLPMFVKLIPRAEYDDARKSASDSDRLRGEFARQVGAPYGIFRSPLLSPSGLPCNAPPWGTIAAVDLFSGVKAWDVPLGSWIPGMHTGTITLGGPIASAGGLVFSAAAMDNYLRAFDSETGKQLWEYELPAGGQATPMTYTVNGKQYLVIAAGGHGKLGTKQGDYVIAFTLP